MAYDSNDIELLRRKAWRRTRRQVFISRSAPDTSTGCRCMRTLHTLSDSTINTAREINMIAAQGQPPYRITFKKPQHPAMPGP